MIRDTSAQDRLINVKPSRKKKLLWIGGGVAAVIVLAIFAPGVARLFSADSSVSASRLAFATVQRGSFIRDIAAEGQVVAASVPRFTPHTAAP
jgi:HlyD family secretion protein